MADLLVSVRSAEEAVAALDGGAAILDVKEPDRGPLGRADPAVWSAVRRAVPPATPVTVALGELADWHDGDVSPADFEGIALRKLGLAGHRGNWAAAWAIARQDSSGGPPWVAVAYADWSLAEAPGPEAVVDAALAATDCAGLLIDTWHKGRANPLDPSWLPLLRRARAGGLFLAIAGGLDVEAIARLAPLVPDIVAVRGAACGPGGRRGTIDPARVAALARAVRSLGGGSFVGRGSFGNPPQPGRALVVGGSSRRLT